MKAILVERVGEFTVTDIPVMKPSMNEMTVKVSVTGLCRTDLKIIRSGHRDLVLPRVPGEEVVGVVHEKGMDVSGFNEGDLVWVYPGTSCGSCRSCKSGAENLCRDMEIMGFHRDGGFAEYVVVPETSLIRVPEGISHDEAVFAEPLSCCLNALELARLRDGDTVGIWGAGPAGTLLHRAAKAMGVQPFSIEPDERRRMIIDGYEEYEDGNFDACIVAVGSCEAYSEAMKNLGPRGRLVVFSGLSPTEEVMKVSFNRLHYCEQTLVGAYGCSFRHGEKALELIANGDVPVMDMISHRMPLEELGLALEMVADRSGMKILLYP